MTFQTPNQTAIIDFVRVVLNENCETSRRRLLWFKMFNSRRVVQDNDHTEYKFQKEVVGVTLTRTELTLVLTMYIAAVIILVVVFEMLKPSISAHIMGSN
uniref:Uncharacterized protein n=1 Tax=Caenorhabditis japonica TaxID=281687 RepID=A0A8R1E662_CAEJA